MKLPSVLARTAEEQQRGLESRGSGHQADLPPGPKRPAILNMLQYARNPYAAVQEGLRYGECYTVNMVGQPPVVMFNDPEAIREIFAADTDVLRAGEASSPLLGPVVGDDSLLVLDGVQWRRGRQLMQPAFHRERMEGYATTIIKLTNDVINSWRVGEELALQPAMQTITLEVIMRVVFGVEDSGRLGRLRDILHQFLAQLTSPAAAFLLFPAFRIQLGGHSPWARFVKCRRAVNGVLLDEINTRRREGTDGRTDVLSMLVEARDDQGQALSDSELLDQMFTLLNAGHETTATSLAWAFNHVLRHPDVLANACEELGEVLDVGPIDVDQLGKLEYLDAIIQETQRLTPVTTVVLRRVHEPIKIGTHEIPAGVNVGAPIYAIHHHPDLWPQPDLFDPTRFLVGRPDAYTFFPFGGGGRRCLGAAFAAYEMKLVLAQILSRVTMRLVPGYQARPAPRGVAVAPSKGVPVIVDSIRPEAELA